MNMKKIAWIKLPVSLTQDERIVKLISEKGVAAFGAYIYLVCEIYQRARRCLLLSQVKEMKIKGTPRPTIMSVLYDYELFKIDDKGHVRSAIDFLGFSDKRNIDTLCDTHVGPDAEPRFPSPPRINLDRDKDKDYHHHLDADDSDDDDDKIPTIEPSTEDMPEEDNTSENEETADTEKEGACILDIPINSAWSEILMMKSGFSALLKRNWKFALEEFRKHVIVNCKLDDVRNVEDAKKYFHFFVTNPVSGASLHKRLIEHERKTHCNGLYRFEDACSRPGLRFYNGIPIPSFAPPRPDNISEWDPERNIWIK